MIRAKLTNQAAYVTQNGLTLGFYVLYYGRTRAPVRAPFASFFYLALTPINGTILVRL